MSYDREAAELVEDALIGARFTAGWAKVTCPWCVADGHDTKKKNLHVSTRGYYQCWRCGETGWVRRDDLEDARTVAPETKEEAKTFEPPDGFEELAEGGLLLEPARRYLTSRGISNEAIRELRIGACPTSAPWPWAGRVVVPHLDEDGNWLGWVGRIWTKKPPGKALAYLYPSGMRRSLYNAKVLQVETEEPCLLLEGALDVCHFYQQSVAFFGSPTESHIAEIERKAQRPVVVVLDGDMPDKCWALGARLRFDGLRAGSVILPPRADPDEITRDVLLDAALYSVEVGSVTLGQSAMNAR